MKLIAIDLDNTLLNQEKTISTYTAKVIKKIASQGHIITLATGRAFELTKPFASMLDISHPLILNNGALIKDVAGNITSESSVTEEAIHEMLHYADQYNLGYTFYAEDGFHTNDHKRMKYYDAWNKDYPEARIDIHYYDSIKPLLKRKAYKLLIIDNDKHRFDKAYGIYRRQPFANVTKSQTAFLDVLPKNTSKATALQKLAEQFKINQEDIIAFGDNDNDVEMLAYAGLGIAMPNATEPAKAAADQIAKASYKEDGVAKTLENLLIKSDDFAAK